MKKKKVLAFGTFDIFHQGHEYYLKEAKKHGDILEVVVARDSTVKEIKGEYPLNDEATRLSVIQGLDYVDMAFLGHEGEDKYFMIELLKPDVICLGYDQNSFTSGLEEILRKRFLYPAIVRLEGYKADLYKSSKLRG